MSFTLNAQARSVQGKGASRRLRRNEQAIPAIVYGAGQDPQNIAILQKDILKVMEDEAFYSSIVNLNIDGTDTKVIIKDLQRHPAKAMVYHADFQRIDENANLIVNVPLHYINKESCVGVKLEGGRISIVATTLEITCLPKDLPEYLEVDMAKVHVGTILHMSDIVLPEGVSCTDLEKGEDYDQPIAQIISARGGAVAAAAAAADEEAEGADAEGESEGGEDAGEEGAE